MIKKLITLTIFSILFISCDKPDRLETKDPNVIVEAPQESTSGTIKKEEQIAVELAPFDRFPKSPLYPLRLRFEKPIAPGAKDLEENFSGLSITPAKYGTWKWENDSELNFEPKESWKAGEKIKLSLEGLKLFSDSKLRTNSIEFETPEVDINIVKCELQIKNEAPLIQYPVVTLRLNYLLEKNDPVQFSKMELIKAGKSEKLALGSRAAYAGFGVEIYGSELFRPEEDGSIHFILAKGMVLGHGKPIDKDLSCEIPVSPKSWDDKLKIIKEKTPEAPVTILATDPLRHSIDYVGDGKIPLQLKFIKAWSAYSVAHGKPKGITIEKGITLEPEINGTWKSSEYAENIIEFTPAVEWPVGVEYRVTVDQNVFPGVKLKEDFVIFKSPELQSVFRDVEVVSDPNNPTMRQVTGTLKFSHPPDFDSVKRSLKSEIRIEPEKIKFNPLASSATVDPKLANVIYIKTDFFPLPEEPGYVNFGVSPGVMPKSIGGLASSLGAGRLVSIPSKKDIFKIESVKTSILSKDENNLQRILSIESSELLDQNVLSNSVQAYVLPDCKKKENKKLCRDQEQFGDEGLVTDVVLAKSVLVPLSVVPRDETVLPKLFHFSFEAPGKSELFIKVKKSIKSTTGFLLAEDFRKVLNVPKLPKSLRIMHDGALLSLTGSKRLGISLRGTERIEYELARILPHDLHHLVSVTSGKFAQPNFDSYQVALNQLSEKFRYTETIPENDPGKTYFTSVDFSRFMSSGATPQGLFVLNVKQKKAEGEVEEVEDEETEVEEGEESYECEQDPCENNDDSYDSQPTSQNLEDTRLVLLTNLGILVKDNLAGEHNVYVVSFSTGLPVKGAKVKLLGQNGVPLFTKTTNENGEVIFPSTIDFQNEKLPLVYVVEKDLDYSFLPFGNRERQLNFSRFETGGIVNADEAEGLRAMLFSDRGIYRPGEEARFGIIVRRRNLNIAAENLPVELSLRDPRGIEILRQKFLLTKEGFNDFRWKNEDALTGTYTLGLYLIRGQEEDKQYLLGTTSFRIDEFQPDKLVEKVKYDLKNEKVLEGLEAWSAPGGEFKVEVLNLFGTPAVGNKVKGTLLVKPWNGNIPSHPEYKFYSENTESELPNQPEDLGELLTESDGVVIFKPDLAKFSESAFEVEFAAEAFEKDSGRSVVSSTKNLISTFNNLVGWKADGDLSFIYRDGIRKINFISVDSKGNRIANSALKLKLEQTSMISALVKQPNGNLKYQMTPRVTVISEDRIDVPNTGLDYLLKTNLAGDFKLTVINSSDQILGTINYQVQGEGNTTFMADRTSEVGIRLNKTSLEPNEELEVSINVPYAGSGVLTIERDKIYAVQWFKTDSLSSIQKIKVPAGIIGNAYVSVAFVRALDSKEVFSAPLSYGVKPFSIAKSEYTSKISFDVPQKMVPGSNLNVQYTLSEKGKFLVYAIDEGILNFAKYKNPEPVSSFMPKRALEIETYQILDLLLPDHKLVESMTSVGGDEDVSLGKFKNPFSRKKKAPMAFWSGIIDGQETGQISIPVPEYFNGTIRIIGVQVGGRKLSSAIAKTIAQHEFVIDPQVPYFVSPNDEFEVGATIANTLVGSGKDVPVTISLDQSEGIESLGEKTIQLNVPEGEDRSFRMKVKAKNVLGEHKFFIKSSAFNKQTKVEESISIRPPQPFRTSLQSGKYSIKKAGEPVGKLNPSRELYDEKREVVSSISLTPLSIGKSLVTYLKNYPYGCTEQLVSAAFPAILFGSDPEIGLDSKDVDKFSKRAFQTLSSRQRADGTFGLWDASSNPDLLFSVYATHFLMEAREKSFEVPDDALQRAEKFLEKFSTETKYTREDHLAQSYAFYLRARLGQNVSKELDAFTADLTRQWKDEWRTSSSSVFIAGAYKILQLDEKADSVLKKPELISRSNWPFSDLSFYSSVYSYISTKHFPKEMWLSPIDSVENMDIMINNNSFNSFTAAFAILGLQATSDNLAVGNKQILSIKSLVENREESLQLSGEKILQALVPLNFKELIFTGEKNSPFFYSLSESGFDLVEAPKFESGFSITREVRNDKQELKDNIELTDKLEVTLFIKASKDISQVAVLELLPGGFEIDLSDNGLANRKSLGNSDKEWLPDFIDIQEDRLIFFGNLPEDTVKFTYRLKPLSKGKYKFPAPYGESMYDSSLKTKGEASFIEIK